MGPSPRISLWRKLGISKSDPAPDDSKCTCVSLHRHVGGRIAGGEGVVVGEDHGFGTVVAEGGFVVAADDGEGVEDVGGRVSPPFLDHRTAPPQAW